MNEQANISNQVYGGLAALVRWLGLAVILIGVILLARIVLLFFGTLKTVPGYDQIISGTEILVSPLGSIDPVETPYDGVFDIAATGILLIFLIGEFILSGFQGWLSRQKGKSGQAGQTVAQVSNKVSEPVDQTDQILGGRRD